jgi:hypothetical protein
MASLLDLLGGGPMAWGTSPATPLASPPTVPPDVATVPKYPPAAASANPMDALLANNGWQQPALAGATNPMDALLANNGWPAPPPAAATPPAAPAIGVRQAQDIPVGSAVTPASARTIPVTAPAQPAPAQPAPLPQILNGLAAAPYLPSNVGPGRYSALETQSLLSPQSIASGAVAQADLDRYIRNGGGQLGDARPDLVAQRQAAVAGLREQGNANRLADIKQQEVDITRERNAFEISDRARLMDVAKETILKGGNTEDVGRNVREYMRATRQAQGIGLPAPANIGVQSTSPPTATTTTAGTTPAAPAADPTDVDDYLRRLQLSVIDPTSKLTDSNKFMAKLWQEKGPEWMNANKEAILAKTDRDAVRDSVTPSLPTRIAMGSSPAALMFPPSRMPIAEMWSRLAGQPSERDKRNAFLRDYLGVR